MKASATWIGALKDKLKQGILDDGWEQDWTALGTIPDPKKILRARIVGKSDGIWVTADLCRATEAAAAELGMKLSIRAKKADGARFRAKDVVCEWKGEARAIHTFERPFLNLACYLGGIAWQTARMIAEVDAGWKKNARGSKLEKPHVTSTRKTLPGYRDLAVAAVIAGGGYPHRVSLSGGVLIKENHIRSAGGIAKAIAGCRAVAPHGLKIEIEVTDLSELKQALAHKADVIMLDNFEPALIRKAVEIVRKTRPETVIEASGGLGMKTIGGYAIPGVNVLSVGSLTHSVTVVDLSLLIDK